MTQVSQSEVQRLLMLRESAEKAKAIADTAKKALEQYEKQLKIKLAGQAAVEPGPWIITLSFEAYQSIDWRRELEKRLGMQLSALIIELTPKKQRITLSVAKDDAWEPDQWPLPLSVVEQAEPRDAEPAVHGSLEEWG